MSRTNRTDGVYLLHIVEALGDIRDFLSGKDYAEFAESKLLINAVIRSFEICGEATKNLSDEFRAKYHEIDWSGMAGFRDVLIHQYFGVDLVNVWDAVINFIPETLPKLKTLEEYDSIKRVLG